MRSFNATLSDDILTVENSRIRRRYRWNDGNIISHEILDKGSGHLWELAGDKPDLSFPGVAGDPGACYFSVTESPANLVSPSHGRVDVCFRIGGLEVRRVFRVYPDCPAIACDLYIRGKTSASWRTSLPEATDSGNVENMNVLSEGEIQATVMERIASRKHHLKLSCIQFFDITDGRNNLVNSRTVVPYRKGAILTGNLLFIEDVLCDSGLFILKEAPCSDVQLAWAGCDFICGGWGKEIKLVGIGVEAEDLIENEWTRCYGFVTGVASGGEYGFISSLRSYQRNIRIHEGRRDHMILLNTWGDRGQDTRIGESFAFAELDAASRLGITHFQLDDGWQKGRSSNSAFEGGALSDIWDKEGYWTVHPERFPNGLAPVVKRGRELGVELGVWFNPSKDNSYEHWQEDAGVLIEMYRKYGIRTFKIDGVEIPDKQSDANLRAMFDTVLNATNYEAIFNLDVTAGRRFGYHYFNEYGNIYLENRYTDWVNYYPHWTLRNLWMLSRYVPPQNLQIEFLNKWRNSEKYGPDDPLAPARIPFDYCFAITMMAQPIAWLEASNLPEDAFDIAPIIRQYRQYQESIHSGTIFPIGEEPQGTAWTGFQSILDDCNGYFLVFRELNDKEHEHLRVWSMSGRKIDCKALIGHGEDFGNVVTDDGRIKFGLPGPFSFALYKYGSDMVEKKEVSVD